MWYENSQEELRLGVFAVYAYDTFIKLNTPLQITREQRWIANMNVFKIFRVSNFIFLVFVAIFLWL